MFDTENPRKSLIMLVFLKSLKMDSQTNVFKQY